MEQWRDLAELCGEDWCRLQSLSERFSSGKGLMDFAVILLVWFLIGFIGVRIVKKVITQSIKDAQPKEPELTPRQKWEARRAAR